MKKITADILEEIVLAMDKYKVIADQLISKLIRETHQPELEEIERGDYSNLQNGELLNG